MPSYRVGLLTGALIVSGGLAAAAWVPGTVTSDMTDRSPLTASYADDVEMVQTILAEARGSSLLLCEMASGSMRGNFWWRGREPVNEDVTRVLNWARSDWGDPAVVPLLVAGMADGDPCVARTAARLLGRTDERAASEALLTALRDTSTTVREMAALGLGVSEPEGALEPLVRVLDSDPASNVRIMSAWALGQLEAPEAVEALARALESDDPDLRAVSAMALGEIESLEALPSLVRALQDQTARVRANSAWALGQLEDAEAIPALSRALIDDEDATVRRAAARALGEIDA